MGGVELSEEKNSIRQDFQEWDIMHENIVRVKTSEDSTIILEESDKLH